jgi:hypothetical protein
MSHEKSSRPPTESRSPRPQRIVCYGTSLYVQGMALELARFPDILLIQIAATRPDAHQTLHQLAPDLIIVDLLTLEATEVLALLREYPAIPLVGLDLRYNTVLLLSSRPLGAGNAQELLQRISAAGNNQWHNPRGGHT